MEAAATTLAILSEEGKMDDYHKLLDHISRIVRQQGHAHFRGGTHDDQLIGNAFNRLADALQDAALGNSPHPSDPGQ